MWHLVGAILALLAVAPGARAADGAAAEAPARRLGALVKDYEAARRAYAKTTHDGDTLKTPREQLLKASQALRRQKERCAAGCLELAEKHPRDPAALDALVWVVSNTTASASPENATLSRAHTRALALLRRDHLGSEKLGPLCRSARLAVLQDPEGVKFVKEVLARSPHRGVRAQALASLADYKLFYATFAADLQKQPARAKGLERAWGKEVARSMLGADPEELRREGRRLHERLAKEYADVPDPHTGTLGRRAELRLAALRRPPAPGRPAPEIEGADVGGKKLRLSAYRGKVVLLAFTGDWCAACQALHAQQRALEKKFAGKPFALLDLNSDLSLERRRKINAKEHVGWRAFQETDDKGLLGPIATRWGIDQWPTLFLIDHKGVIRRKYVGSPGEKALAEEVGKLLREAEGAKGP